MNGSITDQDFLKIVWLIAKQSGGRIALFDYEGNEIPRKNGKKVQSIMVDGKKVGQDLKHYLRIGQISWQSTFYIFALDVLMPIRARGIEKSFNTAKRRMDKLAQADFTPIYYSQFKELFAEVN